LTANSLRTHTAKFFRSLAKTFLDFRDEGGGAKDLITQMRPVPILWMNFCGGIQGMREITRRNFFGSGQESRAQ
jgi:hypothetical protein